MKTMALITDILVLPAVLELISAQDEKPGMTKLGNEQEHGEDENAHMAVSQYMTILAHRYWVESGSKAIMSIAAKTMAVETIIQYSRMPRYLVDVYPTSKNQATEKAFRGQS